MAPVDLTPIWVVATLIFGESLPAKVIDAHTFRSEAACILYARHRYGQGLMDAFRLECVSSGRINDTTRLLRRRED